MLAQRVANPQSIPVHPIADYDWWGLLQPQIDPQYQQRFATATNVDVLCCASCLGVLYEAWRTITYSDVETFIEWLL